jgi:hypothetical protein
LHYTRGYTERDSKIGFGRAGILVLCKLNFCHFGYTERDSRIGFGKAGA